MHCGEFVASLLQNYSRCNEGEAFGGPNASPLLTPGIRVVLRWNHRSGRMLVTESNALHCNFGIHGEAKKMAHEKILVVDDEENILKLLQYNLERNGYASKPVQTGEEALAEAKSWNPDLIILDLMLPGIGGLDVCRVLKTDARTSHIPILMLTAKGEDADIVAGLELGADDYVTKPFSVSVLIARVRAVLRKKSERLEEKDHVITIDDLVVNPSRHEVLIRGNPLQFTHTEFSLLYFLARSPGRVFTRQQIIDALGSEDKAVTDRSVDVQVVGIRKKLGKYGDYVQTVRGVGYKFKDR